MVYSTLELFKDENGIDQYGYFVNGDFKKLMYLCVDVFYDKNEGGRVINKSDAEIAAEYRNQLESFYNAVGPLLDDEYIKDYWLVLTPLVCDSGRLSYAQPKESDNYIVTPFNLEEIDLVEKVIVPSGRAGGSVVVSADKRKRLATNSRLEAYVAVLLNDEHPDYVGWKESDNQEEEHNSSVLGLGLWVGDYVLEYMDVPLRTFLFYGNRKKQGRTEPVFVEQYFEKSVKKTNEYSLGEGYVRGMLRDIDQSKLRKYMAFMDMFESRGADFCTYGLSHQELDALAAEFRKSPWVSIEYKR
jgi:hypothetical protein